jgi:alkanesulfonate monooxygenase SsuD/methylene tetrahydromethanopterin reductase-like flavin-dependent oxidoreductase (luciferase family)
MKPVVGTGRPDPRDGGRGQAGHFRVDDGRTFGMWEGWSLPSALAAVTDRVALGTFVTCMGFRNPALLAKMAETVEEISGGRLILGLGAGWHAPEYRAFGVPFDHRTDRFGEAVAIISGLLRHGHVDFVGTYCEAGRGHGYRPLPPGGAPYPHVRDTIALDRQVHRRWWSVDVDDRRV